MAAGFSRKDSLRPLRSRCLVVRARLTAFTARAAKKIRKERKGVRLDGRRKKQKRQKPEAKSSY